MRKGTSALGNERGETFAADNPSRDNAGGVVLEIGADDTARGGVMLRSGLTGSSWGVEGDETGGCGSVAACDVSTGAHTTVFLRTEVLSADVASGETSGDNDIITGALLLDAIVATEADAGTASSAGVLITAGATAGAGGVDGVSMCVLVCSAAGAAVFDRGTVVDAGVDVDFGNGTTGVAVTTVAAVVVCEVLAALAPADSAAEAIAASAAAAGAAVVIKELAGATAELADT